MPTLTKLPFFSKRGKLQIVNFIFYLFIYLFILDSSLDLSDKSISFSTF